jgi:hypothetical protein
MELIQAGSSVRDDRSITTAASFGVHGCRQCSEYIYVCVWLRRREFETGKVTMMREVFVSGRVVGWSRM